MCTKGGHTGLTRSLEEEYLDDDIVPFIAVRNNDEMLSAVPRSKSYGLNGQKHEHQKIKYEKGVKRILLVDDEDDINLTVKLVLEGSGFNVDSFTDPLLAVDSFRPGLYDLVILDVKMPVMNGFGLFQEIRKLDDKVKICFLTAASDVYYEAFGKQAFPNFDANHVIRVPIENELLVKQIKSIIY
jgi:CheY-like chemotaxis protein